MKQLPRSATVANIDPACGLSVRTLAARRVRRIARLGASLTILALAALHAPQSGEENLHRCLQSTARDAGLPLRMLHDPAHRDQLIQAIAACTS
ncbi:MAG: hypothetical protein ACRYHA_30800 [Janthinobacterium lividum]